MKELNSKKKILSGLFWRFGEKIAAKLVSFIVSIILARILMPDDYGIVAIVNVFIVIGEVCVTSGLGTSLIQKKNADDNDFSTIFWCNLIFASILYAIVFFASPLIAKFYNMPLLTSVLRVFSLKLPIAAINSIQNAYIARKMDFKKSFFATIVGTIISGIAGIIMAYMGAGVWALIAQYLINSFIDTIMLFLAIKWLPHLYFDLESAKPLISYGWKILATDLMGSFFDEVDSLILGKTTTSSNLAYYTQGKKIPRLIIDNTRETLNSVLFPAMSLTDRKEEIIQIRRKTLKTLEYILFPVMFGMIAVADKMIIVLMTEKWIRAVPYVRITCLVAIISILGTTLIQEIKAIGRSEVLLKIEIMKKVVLFTLLFIAMHFGTMAIALSYVVYEFAEFAFNYFPVKKYIGFDLRMHLMDALPPFVLSAVMAIIVYVAGRFITNDLLCLIAQIFIGACIYIGISFLTKNELYVFAKTILDRRNAKNEAK